MKKTLIYVSTAMLLGFAIMMFPKTIEPQLAPTPRGEERTNEILPAMTEDSYKLTPDGLLNQPGKLVSFGLILLSGLIAATSVYAITRKQLH